MILAIDLGITTGWVLLDDDGSLLKTGVIREQNAVVGLDDLLTEFARQNGKRHVVVELPILDLRGSLGHRLRELERVLINIHDKIVSVRGMDFNCWLDIGPAQWKNSKVFLAMQKYDKHRMVVHQKDALGIAVWYYYTHYPRKEN